MLHQSAEPAVRARAWEKLASLAARLDEHEEYLWYRAAEQRELTAAHRPAPPARDPETRRLK